MRSGVFLNRCKRGLYEFTPPPWNVETGGDIAEILSILIHLRASLYSGAEYGWAVPSFA